MKTLRRSFPNGPASPVDKMLEGEKEKLLHMEDLLSKRVVGQKDAIAAVANAVRRSRAGIGDAGQPIGSFLFLGPTGVGKQSCRKRLPNFCLMMKRRFCVLICLNTWRNTPLLA